MLSDFLALLLNYAASIERINVVFAGHEFAFHSIAAENALITSDHSVLLDRSASAGLAKGFHYRGNSYCPSCFNGIVSAPECSGRTIARSGSSFGGPVAARLKASPSSRTVADPLPWSVPIAVSAGDRRHD